MRVRELMQRSVETIDADAPALYALQLMVWRHFRHLPVLDDGRLAGVVSERDLLPARSKGIWSEGMVRVRDVMSAPAERIHPDETVADAAGRMSVKRVGCLPVVDAGAIVGIVTSTDMLTMTAQCPADLSAGRPRTVGDHMVCDVITIRPDAHATDAAALMRWHGVRHLPVVDGAGRFVGVLSDRDLRTAIGDLRRAVEPGEERARARELRVEHLMTTAPQTLTVEDTLAQAVDALLTQRAGALPVVDADDRLVGVLSYVDLLAALAGLSREEQSGYPGSRTVQ